MNTRINYKKALKVINLIVVLVMTLGSPFSTFAFVWTDQADYAPGSVVTIHGDNSNFTDGGGYLSGEVVNVQVIGPYGAEYFCNAVAETDDTGYLSWACDIILPTDPALAVGEYTYFSKGLTSGVEEQGWFTDSGGSYTINFAAADPENYIPPVPFPATVTPIVGRGDGSVEIPGAWFANPAGVTDMVESLAPDMMALGQVVPFELEITVKGDVTPENGVINIVADWSTVTTSNNPFGYDENYGVIAAFIDTSDGSYIDPEADATVSSFSWIVLYNKDEPDEIRGTFLVSGLDDGDKVVMEVWLVLDETIPDTANGNVASELVDGWTEYPDDPDAISTGNQTVPLLQVGEFFTNDVNLSVTKTESPDPVVQGQPLTYTLVISNAGPTIANNVIVTDTLPADTSFVSASVSDGISTCTASDNIVTCDIGVVFPGVPVTITIATTVSPTAPTDYTLGSDPIGGTCTVSTSFDLCNTTSVSTISDDIDLANNSDSEPTNVLSSFVPAPAIDIQKTPDTQTVIYGQTATFTIVVTNTGNVDLTNVTVADPNAPNCAATIGSLVVGASTSYTCSLLNVISGFTNVATATGTYGSTTVSDYDNAMVALDILPDISVTKTADPTSVPETGGNVTFTFVVTNNSTEAATITALSDDKFGTLVGDADCQVGTILAVGASCSFEAVFPILAGDYSGSHVNVFSATVRDDQGNTDTATDDETVTYTDVLPDLSVTKTASPTSVPETGGNVTFAFVVTNNSIEAATITALSDDKFGVLVGDADCQVGTVLAAGTSCSFEASFAIPAGDVPGSHTNIFTATVSDDDGNTDTATESETVTYTDVAPAIRITKTASPTHVPETGGDVTFTFLVENIGQEDVTLTTLSDTVFGDLDGKGTCDVPQTILIGGSYSCTYMVTLSSDSLTAHTNVATATAVDDDGTEATDDDDETVSFDDVAPAIRITKTASPTHVPETGGDVTFTFLVENIGQEDVTLTTLSDTVFGDLDGKGTCAVPQTILIGGSYSCTYTVNLSSDSLTAHYNVSTATAVDDDGTEATDDDDETVSFDDVAPAIRITKTASPTHVPETGGDVTFTFLVENIGQEDVTLTSLSDTVFGDLDGKGTCDVPQTILIGGSYSCTYTVNLSSDSLTAHYNVSTATAVDDDGTPATDDDDETITFTDVIPTIDLTKSVDGSGTFNVGDTATFTLTIKNISAEPVTITALSDTYSLSEACTALVGTVLQPGVEVSCTYTVVKTAAGTYPNTALVTVKDNENNTASDSGEASITVYAPTVSKTALGTYDEVHDWEIFKTSSADLKKFAGQSASYSWTVRVDETTHGENYLVTGVITVVNPNPDDPMVLSLSDLLDDGSTALISNCTGDADLSNGLTIPADGTVTCDYSVVPTGDLDNFAAALPDQVSMSVVYPGPDSYFLTTISGDGALNGTYEGWCVDTDLFITPGTTYTASVYSSYEELPDGMLEHPENLDQVNWIINQGFVGTASPTDLGIYTYGDVQRAIWELVEDTVTASITYNAARVAEIRALAAQSGEGFEPTCGDYVAVILRPTSLTNQVITIAQVTFASLGADCADSNTVTAVLNGVEFPANAEILWTANPINPTATLDDIQNPTWPITVSTDLLATYTDPQGYVCPTDPAAYAGDGIATAYKDTNTATITYSDGSKSATDSIYVTCYAPVLSKTAVTQWLQTYDWSLTKTVTPVVHTGFAGDSFTSAYDVFVDQTITNAYSASGVISIKNPAGSPGSMTVNVADMVSGDIAATVDCDPLTEGNQTSVAVATNTTTTCTYAVTLPDATSRVNTATGTFLNIPFTATANVVFGVEPTSIVGSPTISVADSIQGALGSASGDYTFEYEDTFTCSTNAADYTNYADADTYDNTATIDGTSLSGAASVTVNCYIPEISKTAAGAYAEVHDWDVIKTVNPILQSAFAGDTVSYEWTVTVTETISEESFVASGTITLVNHNPEDAMTVTLSDVLSDNTAATITVCTGDADLSDGLTIAAGGTSICDYSAELTYTAVADAPTNNTATVVLNNLPYRAEDTVEWTATVINASASLVDLQNPTFPLEITDGGTWTYSESYTCSTDKTAYDATTNKYTFGESNTATVTFGSLSDTSTASTNVDCYVPVISKDAAGTFDEVHDWDVFKTVNTAAHNAVAGQKVNFIWTVRVDETTHGEEYMVTGDIEVVNPNPEDALTISLSDVLDDGSIATIGPCTGGTLDGNILTVPAGGIATCDYSVEPEGNLDAFAAALPAQVTMSVTYPYYGGSAYFPVTTLSGGTPLDGTYEGWCVDTDNVIYQNTSYTANVFSSYEALPGLVEHPENFDLVNWIINQDFVGKLASTTLGNYTYSDVQYAIWTLIDDAVLTNGLYDLNTTRAAMIVNAARASGEGYTPTCGDFIAVVLQPVAGTTPVQTITIAQVTFASLGVDCAASNVVTAVLNGIEFPASTEILWTANPINPETTLDDDQKLDWPITVSADTLVSYTDPLGYTCSTDPAAYTNGVYTYRESNTALLGVGDSSTANTSVTCYYPQIDVTKTADPLAVAETGGDVIFTFVVQNTSPYGPVTITSLFDSVYGTLAGDDDCKVGTVLAVGASCTFSFTAWVEGDYSGPDHVDVFTADATNGYITVSDTDNAAVDFTNVLPTIDVTKTPSVSSVPETGGDVIFTFTVQNTSTEEPVTITSLFDSVYGALAGDDDCQVGTVLAAGASCEFSITRFVSGDYESGINHNDVFTAHAEDNDKTDAWDDDEATVTFTDLTASIDVEKYISVDGGLTWLDADLATGPYLLTGTDPQFKFVVENTGDVALTTVTLTDSDFSLAGCSIPLTLGVGATFECTITATWAAGQHTDTASVSGSFVDGAGNTESDSDTDDANYFGAAPSFTVAKDCTSAEPVPQEGPAIFSVTFVNTGNVPLSITADDGIGTFDLAVGESKSFPVSLPGPFVGMPTADNTVSASASYTDAAGHTWSASPSADASCRVGSRVDLLKTTNGRVDPSMTWTFSIFAGPDGFGTSSLANGSTAGDVDGLLTFNNLNLDSTKTYTICENAVAAGWTATFRVDTDGDGDLDLVIPYNPNADDAVPEDLGNRCVDFGAGTTLNLLTDGGTLHFAVDNTYPGGAPRTPGYWKNWNTCTGGGQAATALANGGWEAGFWLLDDVLAGMGQAEPIVWDDILVDTKLVPIDSCSLGVTILSAYDIYGTNHNSDGAYTLAKHLLAAQLNYGASARTCDAASDAILAGERLLDKYNFDATAASYLPSNSKDKTIKADYALALSIAATLDKYNNGLLCLGPSVTFKAPLDGDVVNGNAVTLWVDAYDTAPVIQVDFYLDGAATPFATDTDGSNLWSVTWDSTLASEGSHTITAVATNAGLNTGSGDVTITVDNVEDPVLTPISITSLVGSKRLVNSVTWEASVVVTVNQVVAGAVVTGSWSNGATGTCTTDAFGKCTIILGGLSVKKLASVTFTVNNIALAGYEYQPSAITSVTITKP